MLAFKEKFPDWEDFPNGLQVLIVDSDESSVIDVKRLLEACQFEAMVYTSGEKALAALHNSVNSFHVALVEASMTGNGQDAFKLAEGTRHLPVVLMSGTNNMSLVMQGIAMGAADVLQKPLNIEKLRNIWQHVIRKAHQEGLRLVKPKNAPRVFEGPPSPPSVVPLSPLQKLLQSEESHNGSSVEWDEGHKAEVSHSGPVRRQRGLRELRRSSSEQLVTAYKAPLRRSCSEQRVASAETCLFDYVDLQSAISTQDSPEANEVLGPAKEEAGEAESKRLVQVDAFDLQAELEETNFLDGALDFVKSELTSNCVSNSDDGVLGVLCKVESTDCLLPSLDADALDLALEPLHRVGHAGSLCEDEEARLFAELAASGEEEDSGDRNAPLTPREGSAMDDTAAKAGTDGHDSDGQGSKSGKMGGRRKVKVEWTAELHRRFVQAVEQLGIDKAIPSRILDLMGVQCLTRHNIASHLQKYRSNRRHLMAKDEGSGTWSRRHTVADPCWPRGRRDGSSWTSQPPPIQPRPTTMSLPPLHPVVSHSSLAHCPPMHVWGHPTLDHTTSHMWQQPQIGTPATWHASNGTVWQQPVAQVEAWGHPTAPPPGPNTWPQPTSSMMPSTPDITATGRPLAPVTQVTSTAGVPVVSEKFYAENPSGFGTGGHVDAVAMAPLEIAPSKEVLDATIREALKDPLKRLPLGLKPPSMDVVMAELRAM